MPSRQHARCCIVTPGYYVVRTLSHTDRQQTWKVLSRCFSTDREDLLQQGWTQEKINEYALRSAKHQLDFEKSIWDGPPRRRPIFFIVTVT